MKAPPSLSLKVFGRMMRFFVLSISMRFGLIFLYALLRELLCQNSGDLSAAAEDCAVSSVVSSGVSCLIFGIRFWYSL